MPLAAGSIVRASVAPGWVAEDVRVTASGVVTTTETVIQSLTWTANADARYKITAVQSVQSTVAGDLVRLRLRWSPGPTVSSADAVLRTLLPNADVAGKGGIFPLIATLAGASGETTVGVTIVRDTGTGNLTSFGSTDRQENLIMIERV